MQVGGAVKDSKRNLKNKEKCIVMGYLVLMKLKVLFGLIFLTLLLSGCTDTRLINLPSNLDLNQLDDVNSINPSQGQVVAWDVFNAKWKNTNVNAITATGVSRIFEGKFIDNNSQVGDVNISVDQNALAQFFVSTIDFNGLGDQRYWTLGATNDPPTADWNMGTRVFIGIGTLNARFNPNGAFIGTAGASFPNNQDQNFGGSNQVNLRVDTTLNRMLFLSTLIVLTNNTWDFNNNRLINIGTGQTTFTATGQLNMGDNINMGNNVIANIGNAGTDFTSTGGLRVAGNVQVDNNLIWTNGATITKILQSTTRLDFGNVSTVSTADLNVTVTGARNNDVVSLGVDNNVFSAGTNMANSMFFAWVVGNDTVSIRQLNLNVLTANAGAGNFIVKVTRFN